MYSIATSLPRIYSDAKKVFFDLRFFDTQFTMRDHHHHHHHHQYFKSGLNNEVIARSCIQV